LSQSRCPRRATFPALNFCRLGGESRCSPRAIGYTLGISGPSPQRLDGGCMHCRATRISQLYTYIHSTMASPAYYESLLSSAKRLRVRWVAYHIHVTDTDGISDICAKAFPEPQCHSTPLHLTSDLCSCIRQALTTLQGVKTKCLTNRHQRRLTAPGTA
jgi:hypothetical protein